MIIIIDTREQLPLDFSIYPDVNVERATLKTGDYSLKGYENQITIERKSLSDFVGCVGFGRERFKKELERMRDYDFSAVIIESSLSMIISEIWQYKNLMSKMRYGHILGAISAWRVEFNVHFILAENRINEASEIVRLFNKFLKEKNKNV